MPKPNGYTIYSDRSRVIIATGLGGRRSINRKTGDMVQIWILTRGVDPVQAVKTGKDALICGDCPHRGVDGAGRHQQTAQSTRGARVRHHRVRDSYHPHGCTCRRTLLHREALKCNRLACSQFPLSSLRFLSWPWLSATNSLRSGETQMTKQIATKPESKCRYCKADIYRPEPQQQPNLWLKVLPTRSINPARCYSQCWDTHVPLLTWEEVLNA